MSGRRREKVVPHEAESLFRVWAHVSWDREHLVFLGNLDSGVYPCCSWRTGKMNGMPTNNFLPAPFHPSLQPESPPPSLPLARLLFRGTRSACALGSTHSTHHRVVWHGQDLHLASTPLINHEPPKMSLFFTGDHYNTVVMPLFLFPTRSLMWFPQCIQSRSQALWNCRINLL